MPPLQPPLQPSLESAKELPTNPEAIKSVTEFLTSLTPRTVFYIENYPPHMIKDGQLNALQKIYHHFIKSVSNAADDIESPRKGRGRPRKSETTPHTPNSQTASWGAIMSIESFQLDEDLKDLLKDDNTVDRVASFWNALHPSLADSTEQPIPDVKEFISFCSKVSGMSKNNPIDRIRWFFLLLTVGDMAVALFGNLRPTKTAKTLKSALIKKHKPQIISLIESTTRASSNLAFICGTFGIGSLFYLESVMNENFIKNKVTRTGGAFENVKQHITHLRFRDTIRESGVSEVGDAIRSRLREVYKISQATCVVDISDSGEETMDFGDGQDTAGSGHGGESNDDR